LLTNLVRPALIALLVAGLAVACIHPGSPISYLARSAEAAAAARVAVSSVERIVSGGTSRTYRLFVPSGYRPGAPTPLVLSLHGLSLNGAQQERLSGMSAAAERAGVIVAYPGASGWVPRWHYGPEPEGQADVQFLLDVVEQLEARYTIDPARIYAAGISNGAQMAHRLGCSRADRFAGLGLVAGGYWRTASCEPSHPLPIVAFHGTDDSLLPYDGDDRRVPIREWAAGWAARNGCASGPTTSLQRGVAQAQTWDACREDAMVTLYTLAGGGHSWPGTDAGFWALLTSRDVDATSTMLAFFAEHPRP
jgi:polyhydroxybutyrate depolymerase